MKTGDKQAEKLPVTTASIITESKGTFLGLDGIGFLYVVATFVFTMLMLQFFTEHAFPIALVVGIIMYVIMRLYIRGKPDGFLNDMMIYGMRPKVFEHRPRDKRPILKDQEET